MEQRIIKFADSKTVYKNNYPVKNQKYKHWYETDKGETVDCDERIIDTLWNTWILTEGVTRDDNDDWNVFVFPTAIVL
jgi:hypothetical protein